MGPQRPLSKAALAITFLIQVAATAASMAPAVAAPEWAAKLQLPTYALGLYVSVVYGCAMLSSQWGAALVARWGPIRVSQAALVASGTGLLLLATGQPLLLCLGAAVLGFGYGWISPASADILARAAAPQDYALVFSLRQTGIPIGGAVAGLVVPFAVNAWGPAQALILVAALCGLAVAAAQPLRNGIDAQGDTLAGVPRRPMFTDSIRLLMADKVLSRLAWCSLLFSAVQMVTTSYLVTFLHSSLNWSLVAAGATLAAVQVASAAGRVVWGALADRFIGDLRMLRFLAGGAALTGPLLVLLNTNTHTAAVVVLFIVFGSASAGWSGVLAGALVRRVERSEAAAVTSGSLFFTYLGVVLGPPFFGVAAALLDGWGLAYALLSIPLATTAWLLWRAPEGA